MSTVADFPVKPEARLYLDAFHKRAGEPVWLSSAREQALSRFAETGFPTRKNEAWRYLDLRALEREPMLPMPAPPAIEDTARALLADLALPAPTLRLVLVDGRLAPALSSIERLPDGVRLGSMTAAIGERPEAIRVRLVDRTPDPARPFAELNTALFADGFVLDVAAGIALDRPIEIVHLTSTESGAALHTRSLVSLAPGAHAELIETFAGTGAYWRNDVVEIALAEKAKLTRGILVEEAAEAVHLAETRVRLAAQARLSAFVLLLSGGTVRHEASVLSEGEGARSDINGAFVVSDRHQANIVTTVDHAAIGGATEELFKGVAAGRGHGVFQGRITVREGAQHVDAHQMSRNLLLGRRAVIDTKPELEIFADDVKCSHGAAFGDLDEQALFYLVSRGIPREVARRLLIEAFLREAVERVEAPALREHLLSRLDARLARLEE